MSPARAQSAATCAGAAAPATFSAEDLEANSQTVLTATHSIQVELSFNSGGPSPDDTTVAFSGPPGMPLFSSPSGSVGKRLSLGGTRVVYQPGAAGPLVVTATWLQDDGSGNGTMCSASASTTLQISPATPLRLTDPRHVRGVHVHLRRDSDWKWETDIGKTTDLRPLQIRVRGTHKARLPGASVPFKTLNVGIRLSDTSYGGRQRSLATPHWRTIVLADDSAIGLQGNVSVGGIRNKPLSYELQVLQAGRLVARLAAAGKCDVFSCQFKTLKLTR
jgi:hypothetical protein